MTIIDLDVDVHVDVDAEIATASITVNNLSTRFPNVFYDAKTTRLLEEPVVNQRGESMELASVEKEHKEYLNRALKSLIASEVDFVFAHPEFSASDGLSWALCEGQGLPNQFYCPITQDLMMEPVISPQGYTYEREAIENWIKQENGTCPVSRIPLRQDQLRRNLAIQYCIQAEISKPYDTAHRDVQRWKDTKMVSNMEECITAHSTKGPASQTPPRTSPSRSTSNSRVQRQTATNVGRSRIAASRNDRNLMIGVFFVGFLILILLSTVNQQ